MKAAALRYGVVVVLSGLIGPEGVGSATQTPRQAKEQPRPSVLDSLPTSESLRGTAGQVLHKLEIVDPSGRGPRAQLVVRFVDVDADERGGPGTIAVSLGKRTTLVPAVRRPERKFSIPASDVDLQRWRLDGRDILIYVRPNEELTFLADPCTTWTISSDRLNPHLGSHDVACRSTKDSCSGGWIALSEPPFEGDERCNHAGGSPALKFCARSGRLTVRSESEATLKLGIVGEDDATSLAVGPRRYRISHAPVLRRDPVPTMFDPAHDGSKPQHHVADWVR